MNDLNINKKSVDDENDCSETIHTNLYELIEAVRSATRLDEDHLTGVIVSHILEAGNIRMSKSMADSLRE